MNLPQTIQVCCVLVLVVFGAVTQARSVAIRQKAAVDNEAEESRFRPYVALERQDQDTAATGHHLGRVQIKVYRGPDQHGHGHHEHFAPHGYWVKQPADADHHH